MKREVVNFVTVIGLVLLGAAVVLGILTGLLFVFPNMSIFGAKAVNERDTEIVYQDDVLVDAFANGKFILESSGTHVEVAMASQGFKWQNNIVVHEAATGIAFNSLNRTLIEWTQTFYNDELYYRIKVMEPSGIVFNSASTVVYINLPYRDDDFRYDFVLQNNYSNVNFSFLDETTSDTDALLLDSLVVESAASVNIPYHKNISINSVSVKGNNTKFTCQSQVLKNVTVTGNSNTLEFGSGEDAGITGNVLIEGNSNKFTGTSAGKVSFKADRGSLNMSETISALDVETISAPITVHDVTGAVNMTTQTGNLSVDSIGAGLNFTAGTATSPYATATLSIGAVSGATTVENYGSGAMTVHGANGDVSIRSAEIAGGEIDVSFADDASEHNTLTIIGYDGNINVSKINGGTVDISVLGGLTRAGFANVNVQFYKIGTATIRTGSYADGGVNWGNVDMKLGDSCNNFNLYVYYARSANSSEKYGFADKDMAISTDTSAKSNLIVAQNNGGAVSGTVKVYTQTNFYLS